MRHNISIGHIDFIIALYKLSMYFNSMNANAKNLTEWSKNKSFLLACGGQQIAGLVDPWFDVLRAMQGKQASPLARACAAELVVFPGNEQWSEYYHNQDKLLWEFCQAILTGMGYEESKSADILWLIFSTFHMEELVAAEGAAFKNVDMDDVAASYKQITETLNPLFTTFSEDLRRQIAGEEAPEPQGGLIALMRCPAVKFMLRVFLPCAAGFQTTPGILLQTAANGDEKALERLLTIDKHALTISEVAVIYHDRMATDFKRCQATIAKYLTKSPPVVTKRKLKQALGTFLHALMRNVGKQLHAVDNPKLTAKALELNTLTIPDIQNLFTAFSRDSGIIANHETDPDVNDDAFRQAIYRMRKELPPLPGQ